MAQNNLKVLLGFQDEFIVEKHNGTVNFTTNKIGGRPDWPITTDLKILPCPLCQLLRPLVLQIYAPFDNSPFHRTLYLFACINPNCWNQSESWLCLRSQILEQNSDVANVSTQLSNTTVSVTDWCQDADDWDDNNANFNEENGNSINQIVQEHLSDDEEESCSFEEVVRSGLAHLSVDERNANTGAIVADLQGGGAVGRQNSPTASAEIEVDESEIVTIDTPTAPQNDIAAILQEVTPLPQELCQRAQNDGASASILQFLPSFISVGEEITGGNMPFGSVVSDHHIRDLLQEYQQNNEDADHLQNLEPASVSQNDLATLEKYEKSVPAHGDKMFHHFLTKIQMNPGQILRYSRNGPPPLLISPLQEIPRKCKSCQGDMSFELQILPTLIPKLRLQGAGENNGSRIEFGTVLVYTCIRSCWSSDAKVREEDVVVQSEKANVVLTDRKEAIPLLQANIDKNLQTIKNISGNAVAKIVHWGNEIDLDFKPDLILLADCIYYREAITLLVKTLVDLCTPDTKILLSQEDRDTDRQKSIWGEFLALINDRFQIVEIPLLEQHPDYRSYDIKLFQLKPLSS